jgi:hypothetical protein
MMVMTGGFFGPSMISKACKKEEKYDRNEDDFNELIGKVSETKVGG